MACARWIGVLAVFAAGCSTTVSIGGLRDDGGPGDTGNAAGDTGSAPPDTGTVAPPDTGAAPPEDTGAAPPEDTGAAAADTGSAVPDDTGAVVVDTGAPPDVTACGAEVCDGVDNDCDGAVDEDVTRSCFVAPPATRTASPQPWLDACAATGHGTALTGSDDGALTVTLPFAFRYFHRTVTSLGVSSNGTVSFTTASGAYVNTALPFASLPDTVFAFWDDLYQRSGICTATFGTAPDRQFVVQWNDAFFYYNPAPATHLTFEVVLSERTNTIDVLYQRMEGEGARASGAGATIGLQFADGSYFDQVGYNTAGVVRTGAGFRWTTSSSGLPGVGVCRAGAQSCGAGAWGACAGEVRATTELCGNRLDDDCDGATDEGCT